MDYDQNVIRQSRESLRILLRTRDDFQKMRIRMDNRLGLKSTGQAQDLEDGRTFRPDDADMFSEMADAARYMEGAAEKRLTARLKEQPIWNEFLSKVAGVGPTSAAWMVAEFDIYKAHTVSAMWAYAGLSPAMVKGKKWQGTGKAKKIVVTNDLVRADKQTSGYVSPFNKNLRTKLLGVLSRGFMALNGGTSKNGVQRQMSTYRILYDDYKGRLENSDREVDHGGKPTMWKDVNPGRRNNAAKRYMIKRFLVDLYVNWRTIEGLPVREEYAKEYLGKVHKAAWAIGKEKPKVWKRASEKEKPRQAKRAKWQEKPKDLKRARKREKPKWKKRATLVEKPIIAERAIVKEKSMRKERKPQTKTKEGTMNKKMKVSEIKQDDELLELRPLKSNVINRYKRAMRHGASGDFPAIIIDSKTKKIVSGHHRHEAYLQEYGEDYAVTVQPRTYKNRIDLVENAITENMKHGEPLEGFEAKRFRAYLYELNAPIEKIASLFDKSHKIIKREIAGMTVITMGGRKIKGAVQQVRPVKRSIPKTVTQMTKSQWEVHKEKDVGIRLPILANQIIRHVDNDFIDESYIPVLENLHDTLDKYLKKRKLAA